MDDVRITKEIIIGGTYILLDVYNDGRPLVMLNLSRCCNHNYSRFIAVL